MTDMVGRGTTVPATSAVERSRQPRLSPASGPRRNYPRHAKFEGDLSAKADCRPKGSRSRATVMSAPAAEMETSARSIRQGSETSIGESKAVQSTYSDTHRVRDLDGWITMSEAGRRGAAEYGKLSVAQCLEVVRIIRA